MFKWLKKLLFIAKPEDANHQNLIVPIRYVNTNDTSFGMNFPGYLRICMNLENNRVSREHIGGTHITDEIIDLDIQLAYDRLPDEYKLKYQKFIEKMNVKIQF